MTKMILIPEATAKQVLEALNSFPHRHLTPFISNARTALREALADRTVKESLMVASTSKQSLQVADEPVACDGDFPEGFDASLSIPAQALRQANAALCEVTNNRMWDVPALAERMLAFSRPQPAAQWVALTSDEAHAIVGNVANIGDALRIVCATQAKLKEKNT